MLDVSCKVLSQLKQVSKFMSMSRIHFTNDEWNNKVNTVKEQQRYCGEKRSKTGVNRW